MTIQRINSIVRTRYETGAYANAAFYMSDATKQLLQKLAPAAERPTWEPTDPLTALLSIPIVLDDTLPEGTWQLRGSFRDWLPQLPCVVLESGTLDQPRESA